ncbi:hypothetical protein P20480_2942 [Pseudoalteromonas sp. BSi20480]|nr:hypothetical protein P20480_2942 [Pseudoalteromonas sp. BSi20480]
MINQCVHFTKYALNQPKIKNNTLILNAFIFGAAIAFVS